MDRHNNTGWLAECVGILIADENKRTLEWVLSFLISSPYPMLVSSGLPHSNLTVCRSAHGTLEAREYEGHDARLDQ